MAVWWFWKIAALTHGDIVATAVMVTPVIGIIQLLARLLSSHAASTCHTSLTNAWKTGKHKKKT